MAKNALMMLLLLACAGLLFGCAQSPSGGDAGISIQNSPSQPANTGSPAADGSPAPNISNEYPEPVVTISNYTFSPQTLRVKVNTTVNWNNTDAVTHKIMVNDFQSPNIFQGGIFKYTFDAAGTYPYYCVLHPQMTGTITVE